MKVCDDCGFYDVTEGICTKLDIYVHGHEYACNELKQQTDVFVKEEGNE